jgi:hypothetical protein
VKESTDAADHAPESSLDESIDQIDPKRLEAILQADPQRLSPPFYNCFSNTFANSPNFVKRLARASTSDTDGK